MDTTSGTPKRAKPWQKPNPKKKDACGHLTDTQKAAARERSEEAGRRYPNLVDNMWAAKNVPGGGDK